jgi:hypothetical protein
MDRILFPGTSCFPLSPCSKSRDLRTNIVSNKDQMKLIVKYMGELTDSDLSFMTDDPAIEYIKKMCSGVRQPPYKGESDLH